MEIDITEFFNAAAPMDYSASVAEIGQHAASDTWRAANSDAGDYAALLATDDALEAFRDHMRDMGFSEADAFRDWTRAEHVALFLQLISGDMREADLGPHTTADEWAAYEADDNARHSIYRGDDGRIYYYLGS